MANEELAGKVADELEDVAIRVEEVAEATRRLTGREVGFFIAGAGIGVAIGFTVGYRIAETRLKTKYSKLAEDEISEMREHYQKKVVAAEPKPPINTVVEERRYDEAEQKAIDETNTRFPTAKEVEEVVVVEETTQQVNVFSSEGWDYSVEVKSRQEGVPYIVHRDEFNENEKEHEQVSYTYYEQDDVLAGSTGETIEDMDSTIGLGNLGHWGHGSGDPNIVYIRNEEMMIDFEVIRDRGSYADEINRNIRHSYNRRRHPNRKFDDD